MDMLSSVRKAVQTRFLQIGSSNDVGIYEGENNPYKVDILILGEQLLSEQTMFSNQEETIRRIGHLAYSGGPEAQKAAGIYLPHMLTMLNTLSTSYALRLQVVKSLSEICHLNKDNQAMVSEKRSLPVLVELAGGPKIKLAHWACYSLSVILTDNIPLMKEVLEISTVGRVLTQSAEDTDSWQGWPENYANVLLDILGISYDQDPNSYRRQSDMPRGPGGKRNAIF